MISINATLVVQVINFLVLMWLLNILLYKPIFRIMEERQQNVSDAKERMTRLKQKAEEKTTAVEREIQEARTQASNQRQKQVDQASAQATEIMNQAQGEARDHLASIQDEAARQTNEVRGALEEYKKPIVEMVFAKVMGRNLT
jgi:F-type H+-transporting ATPase subunit b